MKKALLIIDVQNDYFENGKFPLWNTRTVLENIKKAITKAQAHNIPVVLVQHIDSSHSAGVFAQGTEGANIHEDILKMLPDAPIVTKAYADGFYKTTLAQTLDALHVGELIICGMMTQNCVLFTALSKNAEKYSLTVLAECSTTVNEIIHMIALEGMSTRLQIASIGAVIK